MNGPPTPMPQPILSVPFGSALTGLLSLILGVVLVVVLVMWRRRAAQDSHPGLSDAPWLQTLLDGLPQAALVVDPRGAPAYWNESAAQSFALIGWSVELPLALQSLVRRALDAGSTEMKQLSVHDRLFRVTAVPLNAGSGCYGVLVMAQGTDQASLGAESYRHLLSALAHELRTPLTAIIGHAQVMGQWDPSEDVALWRRSLDLVASEAARLTRLVEDLLTLSRLDLTPLQRGPVNLRAVAEEAMSDMFQAAKRRGVDLRLQSPSNVPRVLGDRDRLLQVFVNLLDNACKYARSGGQVIVSLSPGERHVRVEIRDDGRGIAVRDLPHIFEPLYRSSDVRDIPGTGMGLTIVRTILDQHGAVVDVQSAPGRGTTVLFDLPLFQDDQA